MPDDKEKKSKEKKVVVINLVTPPPKKDTFGRFEEGINHRKDTAYKGRKITELKFTATDSEGKNKIVKIIDVVEDDIDIEYYLFYDGTIKYKINNEENREEAQYYYYDSNNNIHDLGKVKLIKIDQYRKTTPKQLPTKNFYNNPIGGNYIYLVDIRLLKLNYSNGNVKFKLSMNKDTSRFYVNDVTAAALLGAMLNCGYEDFVYNGASNEAGYSAGPSNTHWNGMHVDFRFLRKDKSGKNIHLNLVSENGDPCGWKGLDEVRQNKFNDELYKFGWTSMLAWRYNGKLLNHTIHYNNHNHHLHIQIFKPKIKKID